MKIREIDMDGKVYIDFSESIVINNNSSKLGKADLKVEVLDSEGGVMGTLLNGWSLYSINSE